MRDPDVGEVQALRIQRIRSLARGSRLAAPGRTTKTRIGILVLALALIGGVGISFGLGGWGREPGQVLAHVGDSTITVSDLEVEIARRDVDGVGTFASHARRAALLEEMIERRALAERARAAGYDEHPEGRATFEQQLVAQYRHDQLEARFAHLQISEDELAQAYDARMAAYTRPEEVRAAMIWIKVPSRASEATREELRRRADAALHEARDQVDRPAHFGGLAVRFSTDQQSRYQGGDLGWLQRGRDSRWDPAVVDAVFALAEPGDLTSMIETDEGFGFARLIDRRPEEVQPLARVADGLRKRLLGEKRRRAYEAFHAETTSVVTIERDAALLAEISRDDPEPARSTGIAGRQPPPLPGG